MIYHRTLWIEEIPLLNVHFDLGKISSAFVKFVVKMKYPRQMGMHCGMRVCNLSIICDTLCRILFFINAAFLQDQKNAFVLFNISC